MGVGEDVEGVDGAGAGDGGGGSVADGLAVLRDAVEVEDFVGGDDDGVWVCHHGGGVLL